MARFTLSDSEGSTVRYASRELRKMILSQVQVRSYRAQTISTKTRWNEQARLYDVWACRFRHGTGKSCGHSRAYLFVSNAPLRGTLGLGEKRHEKDVLKNGTTHVCSATMMPERTTTC